jgi:peptide chain release factor-like protein
VLRSDRCGDHAPVLAAVGPMQFEVTVHRMATELSAPISLESLPYQIARIVDAADAEFIDRQVSAEVLTRIDGVMLVLFSTRWRLQGFPTGPPRREAVVVGGGRRIERSCTRMSPGLAQIAAHVSADRGEGLDGQLSCWSVVAGVGRVHTTTSRRVRRWARGTVGQWAGASSVAVPTIPH